MVMRDPLDALFADDSMSSHTHTADTSHVGMSDNLAKELELALDDESYESDTMEDRRKPSFVSPRPKGPAFSRMNSYSGGDWGDPADDSDPDGTFSDFNETMYTFVALLNARSDSAYISDDESIDEAVDHRTEIKDDSGELVERFIVELQDVRSQHAVEARTTTLIQKHEQIIRNLDLRMAGLRSLTNEFYRGSSQLSMDETEIEDLQDCLNTLEQHLIVETSSSVTDSLSLLEAETNALTADICLLNDTLQESRQLYSESQRTLKTVRDACCQWLLEAARVERAQEWLEMNDIWREGKQPKVAQELDGIRRGFENVCADWRRRIEVF